LNVRPYCVGFAAETHDVVQHARDKLKRKGIPLIVANHGPSAFGRDDNTLMLIDENTVSETPRADKLSLARALIAAIAQRLHTTPPKP
jgi:phosphopantothenoylcysteine decarboxylase / phosphopantothenate---cysteine ligase